MNAHEKQADSLDVFFRDLLLLLLFSILRTHKIVVCEVHCRDVGVSTHASSQQPSVAIEKIPAAQDVHKKKVCVYLNVKDEQRAVVVERPQPASRATDSSPKEKGSVCVVVHLSTVCYSKKHKISRSNRAVQYHPIQTDAIRDVVARGANGRANKPLIG